MHEIERNVWISLAIPFFLQSHKRSTCGFAGDPYRADWEEPKNPYISFDLMREQGFLVKTARLGGGPGE